MEILRDLSTLEMGTNLIGTKGARYLAQSKTLVNLTSLNLFYNAIGNDGVKHIAISDNLLSLSNLTLSDNNITDEGAKYLPSFCHCGPTCEGWTCVSTKSAKKGKSP